jgi:hypothetical protein
VGLLKMLNFYIYMTTKYIFVAIVVACVVGLGIHSAVIGQFIATDNGAGDQKIVKEPNIATVTNQKITTTSVTTKVSNTSDSKTPEKDTKNAEDEVPFSVVYSEFPPEVDTVAGLISISTNVFIGKVINRGGAGVGHARPSTRFEVEVVGNITGEMKGKVFIDQIGVGYKNGKFIIMEDDIARATDGKINPKDVYLKTGGSYLFVAHCSKPPICGISAPPYDRELITADNTLSNTQLLTIAENNPRVQEFLKVAGVKLSPVSDI